MSLRKYFFKLIFGKRLPKLDGTIQVNGNSSDIKITRDIWGIPYIKAATVRDAWFGMGFCQGQDRSFQLELIQRLSSGTLSEIFGSKTVSIDRLSRQIGFHRSSKSQFENLDEETRNYMQAFSDGVNEGREKGSSKKPHEFSLLKFEPSLFNPEDTLGTLKLFGFQMGSNWDSELARLQIILNDGTQSLIDLDPEYSRWHPLSETLNHLSQTSVGHVDRLSEDIKTLSAFLGANGGSNNWAVSGAHTDTGRPILCNDPHYPPHYRASGTLREWRHPNGNLLEQPLLGCQDLQQDITNLLLGE